VAAGIGSRDSMEAHWSKVACAPFTPTSEWLTPAFAASESHDPVLIVGEPGSGKSALALVIHRNRRRSGPLMVFDCAASEPDAWEAIFHRCTSGSSVASILLERLNDAQPQLQAYLLRSLDASLQKRPHILATITSGFETSWGGVGVRRDLLDRVAVRVIHVPALRERGREFENIVREVIDELESSQGPRGITVSDQAMAILRAYRWPGNVRELRNLLARAMRATRSHQLGIEALPTEVFMSTIGRRLHLLERLESAAILGALNLTGGNVSSAAEQLGLSRATLYRRLRSYELLNRAVVRGRGRSRSLRQSTARQQAS
jgi:sigma-54 dependent transcriptional regulator, acetoin dehydrogenase operon transcriptional activator AcoR